MTSTKLGLDLARAPVEAGVTVRVGLDVHADQITVCRQIDGRLPQPIRVCSWPQTLELMGELRASGAVVHSCYEAGPCGYGLHRQLLALGVVNVVVVPRRWDESGRRVKTDRRDAQELCERLDRYLRGSKTAFSVVCVPSVEQERRRLRTRHRGIVLKERNRNVLRGHGLLLAQGVQAPSDWWGAKLWPEFAAQLPPWLCAEVSFYRHEALRLDQHLALVTAEVEQLSVGQLIPKGVGALTAALLQSEILDWRRFHNRRQVGSYTGLCPSEHSSGHRRRQGAVNKHGNPCVRQQLVEAIWRLLQWQPDYPPLRAVRAAPKGRARKRAVVAAARRLAIDLWRINTARNTPEQLGLRLASSE